LSAVWQYCSVNNYETSVRRQLMSRNNKKAKPSRESRSATHTHSNNRVAAERKRERAAGGEKIERLLAQLELGTQSIRIC
jgi:hypothetical protein